MFSMDSTQFQTLSDLIKRVNQSVVRVQIKNNQRKPVDSGTGVCIGKNTIATCYHVIDPLLSGTPFTPVINGNDCKILHTNTGTDLAILEYKEKLDYQPFKVFNEIEIGDEVIFSGFPLIVKNLTTHKGMVSAKGNNLLTEYGNINLIQINGTINLGNSGGPIFDINSGKLMGIITAKYAPFFEGVNKFANIVRGMEQQPEGELGLGKIDWGKYVNFVFNGFATLIKPLQAVQVGIGYVIPTDYLKEMLD